MITDKTYNEEIITEQLHDPERCRDAFSRVIAHYTEPLYWQIRRMVIDHDDTNDLLQNTFIKAWTNIDNFRGEANSPLGSIKLQSMRLSLLSTRKKPRIMFLLMMNRS